MAKTQLNVRVDEGTARAARERATARGMSVNRYIEELVRQDAGEIGHTFVEAASDFMKQYEAVFVEEFGAEREGGGTRGTGTHEAGTREAGTREAGTREGRR
ncbi:antitoxin [Streptomyces soliscabiei]|uniref:antitoxin n=1 Tax=Streptomyces soliscabiei TaxID=588897 RepID=UPI0029AACAE1|nr:antitoxin [Streptomyces sp. NY05-11A]MDX2681852.1 antitoxin [Streptomyces sp. NY05-11A]